MQDNKHKGAPSNLFHYARVNRKSPTEAEALLWKFLRGRRLHGVKFRRQHPIGDFIVDFYSIEFNLVIEIDGGYHNEKGQQDHDECRTFELNELGVKVIRLTNDEVLHDLDKVLLEIRKCLQKLA